jgi:hypothetical protein
LLIVYCMLAGRAPSQRAVWPLRVVACPPILDEPSGIGEAPEPVDSAAFIAEFAVEALQMPVLHGPPRRDEVEFDLPPYAQTASAYPMNSGPLSRVMRLGAPCHWERVTFRGEVH